MQNPCDSLSPYASYVHNQNKIEHQKQLVVQSGGDSVSIVNEQQQQHHHHQQQQQQHVLQHPQPHQDQDHHSLRQQYDETFAIAPHLNSLLANVIRTSASVAIPLATAAPPSPSKQFVPIHYKFYTPQRKYTDNAMPRYPYHKNRAIPRKQLIEQQNYIRNLQRKRTIGGGYHRRSCSISGGPHGTGGGGDAASAIISNYYQTNRFIADNNDNNHICLDLQSPTDPMRSLLRDVDLCDSSSTEIDPMLRQQHYTNYRVNKKNLSNQHFGKKSSRYSNVYEYSLTSIFEDFSSDDSL